MKRNQFLSYLAAGLGTAALTPLLTACGGGITGTAPSAETFATTSVASATTSTTLSPEEVAALRYMREEEKLARDVYVALYRIWGANVFYQISLSETTHTETILALLNKYGIADPAAGNAAGVFDDSAMQALYNTLMGMGQVNFIEGLKVGALIEETDIRDINEKKAITHAKDILTVYSHLLCGSGNHLRAFNAQLLMQGVTYVPQVISQADWDFLANAPLETCGGTPN